METGVVEKDIENENGYRNGYDYRCSGVIPAMHRLITYGIYVSDITH